MFRFNSTVFLEYRENPIARMINDVTLRLIDQHVDEVSFLIIMYQLSAKAFSRNGATGALLGVSADDLRTLHQLSKSPEPKAVRR